MHALRLAALLSVLAVSPVAMKAAEAQPASGGQAGQRGSAPAPGAGQAAQPNNPVPQQMRVQKFFPFGASWRAVSLNGKSFSGEPPYFSLDRATRAQGFGGCNTFSTIAYALPSARQQALAVGPLNFTRKACDAATMASEKAFFNALRYAQQWDQQGSTLIIRGPNGELRFERAL